MVECFVQIADIGWLSEAGLVAYEIRVSQCVGSILQSAGPHKLSRQLDAQMEYIFVQHGLTELAD